MTEETRRPTAVVERDRLVANALAPGAAPLAAVAEAHALAPNQVYGSFWRLRKRGLVEKIRPGGRTPLWQLTPAGHEFLQQPPVEAPAPPVPVG